MGSKDSVTDLSRPDWQEVSSARMTPAGRL